MPPIFKTLEEDQGSGDYLAEKSGGQGESPPLSQLWCHSLFLHPLSQGWFEQELVLKPWSTQLIRVATVPVELEQVKVQVKVQDME